MKTNTSPQDKQTRGDDVLFVDDIARLMRTSPRTVRRRLAAGTFPLRPLPSIDKRERFSRVQYEQLLANGKVR